MFLGTQLSHFPFQKVCGNSQDFQLSDVGKSWLSCLVRRLLAPVLHMFLASPSLEYYFLLVTQIKLGRHLKLMTEFLLLSLSMWIQIYTKIIKASQMSLEVIFSWESEYHKRQLA
jgi:hypothetical protein